MESLHRLSMNTSLKNARIFDDDAWDDSGEIPVRKIKQESDDSYAEQDTSHNNSSQLLNSIKEEPFYSSDSDDLFDEEPANKRIKQEFDCVNTSNEQEKHLFKLEAEDMLNNCYNSGSAKENIKNEQLSPPPSPPPPPLWKEDTPPPPPRWKDDTPPPGASISPKDMMLDNSPYNRELFESCRIKDSTPLKNDIDGPSSSHGRNQMRSAKRTVFSRPSPYKINDDERRIPATERLGPPKIYFVKASEDCPVTTKNIPRNMPRSNISTPRKELEMETDPKVLARRQKQIEYGKNTIGYENYTMMVPKSERKAGDPKTPPRYTKYSRRGWEGLIKQWRIQLHKYDPPEDQS